MDSKYVFSGHGKIQVGSGPGWIQVSYDQTRITDASLPHNMGKDARQQLVNFMTSAFFNVELCQEQKHMIDFSDFSG